MADDAAAAAFDDARRETRVNLDDRGVIGLRCRCVHAAGILAAAAPARIGFMSAVNRP
jgi:hypothetical protein